MIQTIKRRKRRKESETEKKQKGDEECRCVNEMRVEVNGGKEKER